MPPTPVPLSEVLLALPAGEVRRVMRALWMGATLTCELHTAEGNPQYVLTAAFGEGTIRSLAHPQLGPEIIHDLMTQLTPALYPFVP